MLNGFTVLDADGHIEEEENQLRSYLEEPYRSGDRNLFRRQGWDISMQGYWGKVVHDDVPTRLQDMDAEGIDVAVLYPTLALNIGAVWGEVEYVEALARAYNNWLADICKRAPDRLKMIVCLPPQSPDFCVREANRAVTDLGAVGVFLPPHAHGKDLGSKEFWPLYEECQRLKVPVGIHSGNPGSVGTERFTRYIAVHTMSHSGEQVIACAGIVLGGIPELFPDLNIAFLEGNVGWVPWLAERMDTEFKRRSREVPHCKARPSEYMKGGRLYYGCEGDERLVAWGMSQMGDDVILYASDYPHWDMDWPNSARDIAKRKDLTEEQKRKLLTENTRRFYYGRV